jgi:hypothetical protein
MGVLIHDRLCSCLRSSGRSGSVHRSSRPAARMRLIAGDRPPPAAEVGRTVVRHAGLLDSVLRSFVNALISPKNVTEVFLIGPDNSHWYSTVIETPHPAVGSVDPRARFRCSRDFRGTGSRALVPYYNGSTSTCLRRSCGDPV